RRHQAAQRRRSSRWLVCQLLHWQLGDRHAALRQQARPRGGEAAAGALSEAPGDRRCLARHPARRRQHPLHHATGAARQAAAIMTDSTQIASLREALLDAQFELRKRPNRGVLVIVTGLPAAGRSETVNDLHGWLNPKYVDVRAFDEDDCAARERPLMWQYWRELPRPGRISFFFYARYGTAFCFQVS